MVVGAHVAAVIPAAAVAEMMLAAMAALLARTPNARLAAVLGFGFGLPAAFVPGGAGPLVAAIAAVLLVAATTGVRS